MSLLEIAQPAIGRGQRCVQAFGFRIDRERVLEILDGLRVVPLGDGDPSETGQNRHRSRREGERVTVNATDPLNLVGTIVPGDRVTSVRTNQVTFVDGLPEAAVVPAEPAG